MPLSEIEQFYPKTKAQWRQWLAKNHQCKDAVWLVMYKKKSGKASITWSDSVDEALCYGWIDSIKKRLDDECSIQYFSKRKAKSTWSKINKEKVQLFIENGQMTQAGLDCITIAQRNGIWKILDSVETLEIPEDLEKALNVHPQAMDHFLSLSKSVRKTMLQWVVMARREDTRQKRILEIVTQATLAKKPKGF